MTEIRSAPRQGPGLCTSVGHVDIEGLVRGVAEARQALRAAQDEIDVLNQIIKDTAWGKRLQELRAVFLPEAKQQAATAEKVARDAALILYERTGDKRVHPDVLIKVYHKATVQWDEALDYARVHLPKCLTLNKRAFERVAKVLDLDFVTWRKEPRATISRDLSKYEKEE